MGFHTIFASLLLIAVAGHTVSAQTDYTTMGRQFALAFPPVQEGMGGQCLIYISALQEATVTIQAGSAENEAVVFVGDNSAVTHEFDCSNVRVSSTTYTGRVIHIQSTNDISIYALSIGAGINDPEGTINTMDGWPVVPIHGGEHHYRLAGTAPNCVLTSPVIIITALIDNTRVTVNDPNGDEFSEQILASRWDAFVAHDQHFIPHDEDYSGYTVESGNRIDHPISVLVGSPCVEMCAVNETCPQTQMYDSMPPASGLGTDHVTCPLHSLMDDTEDANSQYLVRMVADRDDTNVTFPHDPTFRELSEGEYVQGTASPSSSAQKYTSSNPALLVQYNLGQYGLGHDTGAFMFTTTPNHFYSNYMIFRTPNFTDALDVILIGIIVEKCPVEDLWKNGESLVGKSWEMVTEYHYCYVYVEVEHNTTYELVTYDADGNFAAYLYGYGEQIGFGVNLGENIQVDPENLPVRPPPTMPPAPALGFQTPRMRMPFQQVFQSLNNIDLSNECFHAVLRLWQNRAAAFVSVIRENLGSYCNPDDFEIPTWNTAFTTLNTTTGAVRVDYFLATKRSDMTFSDVMQCAADLSYFISDLENWGRPVLGQPTECADPVIFINSHLDTMDNDWMCVHLTGLSALSSNELNSITEVDDTQIGNKAVQPKTTAQSEFLQPAKLNIALEAWFNTTDLTPPCILSYSNELDTLIVEQVQRVRNLLETGALCAWEAPSVKLLESTRQFTVLAGSYGEIGVDVIFNTYNDNTFDSFIICVQEVSKWLTPFTNWVNELPLLPAPIGCPPLDFYSEDFDTEESWTC